MRETVRVMLRGNLSKLRLEWEQHGQWPFSPTGVALLASEGQDYARLRDLLPRHLEVQHHEMVERSYARKELLRFDAYCLWINHDVEAVDDGLVFSPGCTWCEFRPVLPRVSPVILTKSHAPSKDVAITQHAEILISRQLCDRWCRENFTGAVLEPVVIGDTVGTYYHMQVLAEVTSLDPETMWYEGDMCPQCGRYDKTHPKDKARELFLRELEWPKYDIALFNRSCERSYTHRKIISNRLYRMLLDSKATGFWVQPVHRLA